jgi:enoyl-CoA hydratase/carnithine racemase
LTGAIVNEADALYAGLADHAIAHACQPAFLAGLAALKWEGSARADRANRLRLRDFCLRFAEEAPVALPESPLHRHHDLIRRTFLGGDVAAVLAGLRRAAAVDAWFERPLANLEAGSPTAACVTLEYMRRTRRMGLDEVLALDLQVARQCQRHHDFPEGVRAVLIDKTRDAAWQPAQLADVSPVAVAGFFEPC